jgi:hypothetical protein
MVTTWHTNISEEYKCFTWTPERTGSNHFTDIINRLGFNRAIIENNKIVSYRSIPKHNHFCNFFENHTDYTFIMSTRNPYSMCMSRVGASHMEPNEKTREIIRTRLENNFQSPTHLVGCCNCFYTRVPDYVVRLEHLYEDWTKIPFVKEHPLNLSGELEKLTKVKINNSRNTEDEYWKKYFNQSLADLVYYNFPDSFEFFGYDRNSWK